jgi:shikimate kinase/3-dehydroquinate synthase
MRSLFLAGFMGTGKSTIGPRAAARLGIPFVDTDEIIAHEAGVSIPELWQREGEAKFRDREAAVVRRYLDEAPHVVALGGGSLLLRNLRHAVLDRATVITLTADAPEILRRVGDVSTRPNLAGADPLERIRELLAAREGSYAECHAQLATDGFDADDVASAACAVVQRDPIVLPLGNRTYTVDVVNDAPEALTDAIARTAPSSLVIVTDTTVRRARGHVLDRALSHLAISRIDVTLPPGEDQKSITTAQTIWDAALGARVDRETLVVAFGGGVTSDLAGFAASTLLRGVRLITVPTTLLAMVDASVGGKTGFDHPAGKNLVGTIHQPRAVVIDVAHLSTLPVREMRAGLAEVVKIALVTSEALFQKLEVAGASLLDPKSPALLEVIRDAVTLKARIVRDDELEGGKRALLNLGHTVAHGLEAHTAYRKYLHGEAVALGLCAELEIMAERGFTPRELVDRTRRLLMALGLATHAPRDELRAAARFVMTDKKRRGATLAFPVVMALGSAEVRQVPLDLLDRP